MAMNSSPDLMQNVEPGPITTYLILAILLTNPLKYPISIGSESLSRTPQLLLYVGLSLINWTEALIRGDLYLSPIHLGQD